MERTYCTHCGHFHNQTKCLAIAHNDTGGAYRCACTGQPLTADLEKSAKEGCKI